MVLTTTAHSAIQYMIELTLRPIHAHHGHIVRTGVIQSLTCRHNLYRQIPLAVSKQTPHFIRQHRGQQQLIHTITGHDYAVTRQQRLRCSRSIHQSHFTTGKCRAQLVATPHGISVTHRTGRHILHQDSAQRVVSVQPQQTSATPEQQGRITHTHPPYYPLPDKSRYQGGPATVTTISKSEPNGFISYIESRHQTFCYRPSLCG